MKALVVEGVSKSLGKTRAVSDLSFSAERGAIHALVGTNGSGKSTTLRMIAGLLRPDNGTLTVFGRRVDGSRRKGATIGYMPEGLAFRGETTAVDLLDFYLKLFGIGAKARTKVTEQLLERVGILEQSNAKISSYTKGMKQRLGLAQALVGTPELLLLDEPTAGLDPLGVVRFREVLRALADEGATILVATHDLDEVERLCDEVTMLDRGHAVVSGTVDEVRQRTGSALLNVELLRVDENMVRALRSLPCVESISLDGRVISVRLSTVEDVRPAISKTVTSCGGVVLSFGYPAGGLEDAFLRFVVSKGSRGEAPLEVAALRDHPSPAGAVRSVIEVTGDLEVGGHFEYTVDIVNVGSTPVWLTKLEGAVPKEADVEDVPSKFDVSERSVFLGDARLDPLQAKTLKFGLTVTREGRLLFRPKVHYIDARGERRIHFSKAPEMEIVAKDAIRPDSEGASKILEFLKAEFLRDSLDLRLNRESAGWRSMVQVAGGTGVSASSLYGKNGRFGKAVSDLLRKGAIEAKTFTNQRGRGGEVVRLRIHSGLDWVKRDLERRENALGSQNASGRR